MLPKAEGGDASLRLVWTAGPTGGIPSALALLSTVPDWIEAARERGATAVSLLGVRASAPWLLPGVKSTSYAVNMAAEAEARRRGVDEALFVDGDGIVLEGTVTNIWWRVGCDALHAVARTRDPRGRDARGADRARTGRAATGSRKGAYPLTSLLDAEEAFTSSSVREVMPLVEVDGQALGRGPAADALQAALRELAAKV